MTLVEIAQSYLVVNGYDGFVQPDGECGCCIKHGLFTCCDLCSGPHRECTAGFLYEAEPGHYIEDSDGEHYIWFVSVERDGNYMQHEDEL